MPQTGRAHSGPVTNTTVQNTTPTSAVTTARASVLVCEKHFLIRKYKPAIARPVVATDDGSMPSGSGRITNAAMQAAIAIAMTVQFVSLSAIGLGRTRYWMEQTKLIRRREKQYTGRGPCNR